MSDVRIEGDDRELVLETDQTRFAAHLNRGTFDVTSGEIGVHDCAASVEIEGLGEVTSRGIGFDAEETSEFSDSRGSGVRVRLVREREEHEPDLALTVCVYESLPYALFRIEARNGGANEIRVGALKPVAGGRVELSRRLDDWRFYKHGWQSWSPTLALGCEDDDIQLVPPVLGPGTSPAAIPGRFVSELMTTIVARELAGLVAGFVTGADQMSQVWFDREGAALTAASYADWSAVAKGERIESEVLYVEPTKEPLLSMERYGDVLGEEMGAIPYDEVASGWCSWYQYFAAVTEEDIISNLERLTANRDELPLQYIQIDDGYQAEIGDWLTLNGKFPSGMKALVERIHDAGFEAGLWLAPFLMGANSQLYKDHPDWVVQFKAGTPHVATINWGQLCYALDLSRDDVIEWLREVFTTVTDDWGFDYVKIDFIYAGAVDGIRASNDYTRAQVYRRGLQTIRDAVGARFILGCGNPLGPSIGLVDGSRVGEDVAPFWHPKPFAPIPQRNELAEPATINAIRNSIARWWMHGRLWMNDPDCLMVRDQDTELSEEEVRTLTTVIGMTGGMVLDSDDLAKAPPDRQEMISMLLPVYGKSAVPVDLFRSEMPQVLELDCESHRMLALFNWSDKESAVSTSLGDVQQAVFDAWRSRYLGEMAGDIELEVPAHGCRLLRLSNVGRPQVAGSSFHILQGAVEAEEQWDGRTLTLNLKPVAVKEGSIWLRIPGEKPATVAGAGDAKVDHQRIDGAMLCRIDLEVREPRELTITPTDG